MSDWPSGARLLLGMGGLEHLAPHPGLEVWRCAYALSSMTQCLLVGPHPTLVVRFAAQGLGPAGCKTEAVHPLQPVVCDLVGLPQLLLQCSKQTAWSRTPQ